MPPSEPLAMDRCHPRESPLATFSSAGGTSARVAYIPKRGGGEGRVTKRYAERPDWRAGEQPSLSVLLTYQSYLQFPEAVTRCGHLGTEVPKVPTYLYLASQGDEELAYYSVGREGSEMEERARLRKDACGLPTYLRV